jgi:hypothetical protein
MAKRFIGNVKGVGVSDFSWEYYLSSSSAVLDGGSWSATPPTLGNNKYLWMRSKVTLTDGTIQYTVPVCEGVWEEIYGIYAIGDKVDGALSDVTDLKSRMTAEESKVQPIDKGGTGAITATTARAAILENKALSITEGGTGKTTATEALKALGGVGIKKLWTNASPESYFPEQTIQLNATDASFILVVFKITTTSNLWKVAILTCDGNAYIMDAPYNTDYSSSGTVIGTAFRGVVCRSDGIQFGKGYSKDHTDKNPVERPSFVIPVKIFAVKGVI